MNMMTFSGPYELVAITVTEKPQWIFSERARSVCGGHASPGRHAISFVSAFFSPIISLVFVWSHLREPLNMSMVPLVRFLNRWGTYLLFPLSWNSILVLVRNGILSIGAAA